VLPAAKVPSTSLSRLGIPVIRLIAEETEADLDTLEQWPAA
jgi:hypothetical protein